jgi:hypothetical protein
MIDDDPDPVEEIRAIRRGIMRKHKTLDAYFAHLSTLPSPREMHDQIKAKLARREKESPKRRTTRRREQAAKA